MKWFLVRGGRIIAGWEGIVFLTWNWMIRIFKRVKFALCKWEAWCG